MGNSGQIGLSLPALPSGWLSDTVFKLFKLLFCGFSRNDGQIATEVPLTPNLLILCGRQSRCWLYLAKMSAQNRLFTGFCSASGQSNLQQLYLPNRPDAPYSKWQTQSILTSAPQKNTRSRPFRICSGHISFRYSSIKSNILTCSILKSDSTSRFTSSPFIWVASTLCTPLRMLDSRSFTT